MRIPVRLLVVLAVAVAGCGRPGGPVQVDLVAILPLSSGVAEAADSTLRGVQLAVAEVNAEGRIRMDLQAADDGGSVERAAGLFRQAATKPRLAAVIGGVTDSVAIALSPLAARAQVPLLSPGATGEIPYAGSYFFRTALPSALQGEALARFALRTGLRRMSVMYDSNEYGTAVALAFGRAFRAGGGVIVGERLFQDGTRDFGRYIRATQEEKPQAILFAGYPDEGRVFVTQAAQAGLQSVLLVPDSFAHPKTVRGLGGAAYFVVAASFFPESGVPVVRGFVRAYRAKYGEDPDPFAAQAYDATKIIAFALRRVSVPERGSIDRGKIRDAIAGIRDYPGVTGNLTFDRFGTPTREVLLLRVRGQELVVLGR